MIHTLLVGTESGTTIFKNTWTVSSKITHTPSIWSRRDENTPVHTTTCASTSIAALCLIARNKEQPACPPTGQRGSRLRPIPTSELCSAGSGGETLVHTETQTNLKITLLQIERPRLCKTGENALTYSDSKQAAVAWRWRSVHRTGGRALRWTRGASLGCVDVRPCQLCTSRVCSYCMSTL